MSRSTVRSVYFLTALGLLILGLFFALNSVPKIHWRLSVLRLKILGSLPDLGWGDLIRMSRPNSPIRFDRLAESSNPYSSITNPYNSIADIEAGAHLFQSHCTDCHGVRGTGGRFGPRLQDRPMVHGSSDWALFRTISHGVPGTSMQGNKLPERDTWQLVAYVDSLVTGPNALASLTPVSGLADLKPVRYEQILAASGFSDRWLTYSGSYDSHRFSPDTQITPANAGGIRLLWMRQYTTTEASIETSPLVIGDYMFVTVPPSRVEALDARTGSLIWSYDRNLPDNLPICCGIVNRGLAVLGKTLYFATIDAHLVALDMGTGRVSWDVEIADYKSGYSITSAPLVVKDSVVTGVAGGEFGIRGFIQALDAGTGNKLWRFGTVPQPGQPASETWGGDSWKTGGAPTWLTGSFDPETNLLFWPVGNPGPNFSGDRRTGDNLYSNSVVALDADSGSLRWHFQFTPHDQYDWDANEILVLFDKKVDGKQERLLAQANRNGFYYLLNRETGAFRLAIPYAKQTWAQGIDSRGRPVLNPDIAPPERGTALFPGVGGGTNWESPSYDAQTGLLFVPFLDRGGIFHQASSEYRPGQFFLGGSFEYFSSHNSDAVVGAIDALTGQQKWEYRKAAFTVGGVLGTAGGVVFGSEGDNFFALDARTGRELWHVSTGSRIVAAPISYRISGKQVVTIAAGHDILTFGL